MIRNNRVILNKNGTLTDLSVNLSNPISGTETINITAATDQIYIGSDIPFNHRWIEVYSANAATSAISVSLWNGSNWVAAVDLCDETSSSGKTLAQSGIISWVPNRYGTGWSMHDSTENMGSNSVLTTLKIYDCYWAKISFSGNLTSTTSLKFLGQKFSKDEDLFIEYPDLNNASLMDAYESGKTSWSAQAFRAAEYIVQDLRERGVIWSNNQILDWMMFKNPSVHKTAELAFIGLGKDYAENAKSAAEKYRAFKDGKVFNVDKNVDARLDFAEKQPNQWVLGR